MKYNLIIFLLITLINQTINAQCADPDISIWENTWRSCEGAINPNPNRDVGHWIMYDFGSVYRLTKTRIWNDNETGATNQGFNEVIVDYSEDGNNWNTLGDFVFPQAGGAAVYEGFEGPDFEGKLAQYVIISAVSNWGDPSCYGLAEVKFNLISDTLSIPDVNPCPNPPCDSTSTCTVPNAPEVSHMNPNEVLILWPEQENVQQYNFRFRMEGNTVWTELVLEDAEAFLGMLVPETNYEFQIQSICGNETSTFSQSYMFTTIAELTECALPLSSSVFVYESTFAMVSWSEVPEAMEYEIRYRKVGGNGDWITITGTDIFQDLENLEPESEYRYQIRVLCPNGWTDYSPFYYFETPEGELVNTEELEKEQDRFWMYPNPALSYTSVRYHSTIARSINIRIFNIVGQEVKDFSFQAINGINNYLLPLDGLESGAYIVRLKGEEEGTIITRQLIVVKDPLK